MTCAVSTTLHTNPPHMKEKIQMVGLLNTIDCGKYYCSKTHNFKEHVWSRRNVSAHFTQHIGHTTFRFYGMHAHVSQLYSNFNSFFTSLRKCPSDTFISWRVHQGDPCGYELNCIQPSVGKVQEINPNFRVLAYTLLISFYSVQQRKGLEGGIMIMIKIHSLRLAWSMLYEAKCKMQSLVALSRLLGMSVVSTAQKKRYMGSWFIVLIISSTRIKKQSQVKSFATRCLWDVQRVLSFFWDTHHGTQLNYLARAVLWVSFRQLLTPMMTWWIDQKNTSWYCECHHDMPTSMDHIYQ